MRSKFQILLVVLVLLAPGCLTQQEKPTINRPFIEYYTIYAKPSLADHTMEVETEVLINIPASTNEISFCLNPSFSLTTITDEEGTSVTFERDYDLVTVDIPPLPEFTQKKLTFTYEGMVYRRVLNVTWDYVSEEGCWVRAEYNWYPVIPEPAEKGCHYFTYCMNNYWAGVELSNFWDYWHQSPWTGMTLSVEVPESWTVITSGTQVSEEIDENTKVCTWEESQPIPSINFVAGDYDIVKDTWKGIEITSYLKEHKERAHEYIDLSKEMLDFFSEKCGEYLFSQLRIVELPGTYGYSQGNPSFVMLDSAALDSSGKDLAQALGGAIAYQWWGNAVNGYDMSAMISLDVCLSNYMSLLYLREMYGQDEFCSYLTECRSEVVEAFAEYGGSSVTYEFAFILSRGQERRNAVVLKTLLMFEALREDVGEEVFIETLRRFIADHKEESVTMETFKQEFEQLSGKDLDHFFEQYYYGIDIPYVMCS